MCIRDRVGAAQAVVREPQAQCCWQVARGRSLQVDLGSLVVQVHRPNWSQLRLQVAWEGTPEAGIGAAQVEVRGPQVQWCWQVARRRSEQVDVGSLVV